MSSIDIQKISITDLSADAIVNAANEGLWAGGGVCGAIFREAGYAELQAACDKCKCQADFFDDGKHFFSITVSSFFQ